MDGHACLESLLAIILCLVRGIDQDAIHNVALAQRKEVADAATDKTLEDKDVALHTITSKVSLADSFPVFFRQFFVCSSKIGLRYLVAFLYRNIVRCANFFRGDIDAIEGAVFSITFFIEETE